MRTRIAAVTAPLSIMAVVSCVSRVPVEGAPCPCAAGWICDQVRGICVAAASRPIVDQAIRPPCTATWEEMQSGTKASLNALWGTSASDIFAVGTNGTILHYDGSAWAPMASPTTRHLMGVWGTSAADIFAVGGDFKVSTALHYDGISWKDISPTTKIDLSSVWGTSSRDVFVTAGAMGTGGDGGMILHYDGASWQPMMTSAFQQVMSVWGLGPQNVFAVGRNVGNGPAGGEVWHYDGAKWSSISLGLVMNLWTVRAADAGSVLAAGDSVLRCTATECKIVATPGFQGLWVAGPDCAYIVSAGGLIMIMRSDGQFSWSAVQTTGQLRGVWAPDCSKPFIVGSDGTIFRHTCK